MLLSGLCGALALIFFFVWGPVSVESLGDMTNLSSWKWFLGKNPANLCSSFEWEANLVMS